MEGAVQEQPWASHSALHPLHPHIFVCYEASD